LGRVTLPGLKVAKRRVNCTIGFCWEHAGSHSIVKDNCVHDVSKYGPDWKGRISLWRYIKSKTWSQRTKAQYQQSSSNRSTDYHGFQNAYPFRPPSWCQRDTQRCQRHRFHDSRLVLLQELLFMEQQSCCEQARSQLRCSRQPFDQRSQKGWMRERR
jgi:hypothetical protein